ncbi:uncharacterized protein EHS24_002789 [Apiotrichum porosum]|uniref:Heterokaryon incompatibility protein HET-C n=1 Tax=Apiotrichum porosum TaxID=105984 RepID=A0A427XFN5_9TREE|nr:uncharacterized protein EHS24_002789 [Apiotrichum porosum]RSH77731.1 hypothetical protein EHS24_002789 [Apiotrichum porosum]
MARSALFFIVVAVVALSFAPKAYAFGAGNIPSYSYLEDKAFRHGDIEDILANMAKAASGGFLGRSVKFTGLDVKRTYFGNWLRDYSQAVDVGALKKAPLQTIINVVMVLGFLAHGYVTGEFEVTKERLGCYLPTEHIDNPKGYADGEDARKIDPRLRGPIDPRELEIDPQTGMKNYIANEGGNWDTSKALVRRTLLGCIDMGRRYASSHRTEDQYEAMRLLGQALHTLEDFSAHSNFCELALISMGNQNVFPHVGRNVKIRAPNGRDVHPLVTGTFGGSDFIHSLMGEATDHLSQASVSDLSKALSNSRSISEGQSASSNTLRTLFFDLPGSDGHELSREMDDINTMRASSQDPSTMSPQELHAVMWKILSFRDSVMKRIENTLEKIPGLGSLVDKIGNSVAVFVMTTLEPFVKPLLGTATSALSSSSQAVIDTVDQYEVWNDWNASDPTHSFLSKDHFGLILNEPAGQIAKIIVQFSVERIVQAWGNTNANANQLVDEILQCLFHPDFVNRQSQIQTLMLEHMRKWLDSQGKDRNEILNRLTSDNVKAGKNRRIGDTSPEGHVHNSMLPEGGLQEVFQQHNVHVPGSQVLNAGQDILGGKMPWQQGFGTGTAGGAHAWREIDPNDAAAAAAASQGQHYGMNTQQGHYNTQNMPAQNVNMQGGFNQGGYNQGGYNQGGYNQPPPQQQQHYGGGFDPNQHQQGQHQQGYYGNQPPHGHGHGHQGDQYGGNQGW